MDGPAVWRACGVQEYGRGVRECSSGVAAGRICKRGSCAAKGRQLLTFQVSSCRPLGARSGDAAWSRGRFEIGSDWLQEKRRSSWRGTTGWRVLEAWDPVQQGLPPAIYVSAMTWTRCVVGTARQLHGGTHGGTRRATATRDSHPCQLTYKVSLIGVWLHQQRVESFGYIENSTPTLRRGWPSPACTARMDVNSTMRTVSAESTQPGYWFPGSALLSLGVLTN